MSADLTLPVSVEAVRELPEEIARAIEAYRKAFDQHAPAVRAALNAAILSRLTAAEARITHLVNEVQDHAMRASKAEAWAYSATEACDKAYIALTAAEASRDAAIARVERLEKALEPVLSMVQLSPDKPDSAIMISHWSGPKSWTHLTFGDLRRAVVALSDPSRTDSKNDPVEGAEG